MRCKRCNENIVLPNQAGLYWHSESDTMCKKQYRYYDFVVLHNACVSNRAYDKWLPYDEIRNTPFIKLLKELQRNATFNEKELLYVIRGEE